MQNQIDELRTRMAILEKMVLLMSNDTDEDPPKQSKPKPKKVNTTHPYKQRNMV